ncbi:cobaltochelatase CobN subunit [Thermodesulfitimonas autotrophica]|uniref:Cobaltochelatase CobN subunit n=1 Tax=Thermodesulfitimonas autotrophica TaxID=1894989 RepID=A0A3N5AA95_9THEO|nr:cobaltochelatase subunit CobN [Thermodesulfitimonas autotrophica]RPF42539.1 cobaltochelatase CobN subunit [Thermodesulfitimonas autotrophica]
MVRVLFYTAVEGDLVPLARAVRAVLQEERGKLTVVARARRDVCGSAGEEALLAAARECDFVFLHLMGGPESLPGFDAVASVARERGIALHAQPTAAEDDTALRALSTVSDSDYDLLRRYVSYGGSTNFAALLRWCLWRAGRAAPPPPPEPVPWEGIYHPRLGRFVTPEAFWAAVAPGKPVVALLFYQSWWLAENLAFIDQLVSAVEARGAVALPVFLYATPSAALGSRGIAWVVANFLCRDGKPAVDAVISTLMFAQTQATPTYNRQAPENFYLTLGVPVVKAIAAVTARDEWVASLQGLAPLDVIMSMALPEFDGQLITVPVAFREETERDPLTGATLVRYRPDAERTVKVAALAVNWARLKRLPPGERRVAVILHNYPPRTDRIGCAFGLDTPASLFRLLMALRDAGFRVEGLPEDPAALFRLVLAGMTNDTAWLPSEEMARRAVGKVPPEKYQEWFAGLPEAVRERLQENWGPPPGEVLSYRGKLLVPGRVFGNVFVGLQPPRGFDAQAEAAYHSPDLSPPYQYLAFYRWLKEEFGADVVLHLGKHGTLEWLPGKSAGLAATCFPDVALGELPNVYPYIVNNPGEGTQAKRRAWACVVDHLVPVMTGAGRYGELEVIETLCREYQEARQLDPGKLPVLEKRIWEQVVKSSLDRDLSVDEEAAFADFPAFVERLHGYLHEIGDSLIRDGLHILGEVPAGERLVEMLLSLCRLPHGEVPALREAVAAALGYNYEALAAAPGRWWPEFGATGAALLEKVEERCRECLRRLAAAGFARESVPALVAAVCGRAVPEVEWMLGFVAEEVWPRLRATEGEVGACVGALAGQYVPPGPAGAPTRGRLDVLPTGRNFYSVDPQAVPTRAAWEVGKSLAAALLTRYLAARGTYPENVGLVIWATTEMRTGGENVAAALYLLGVAPVWEEATGRVKGLRVISREELGRPRVDVTLRVSGLFRDTFLNVVHLLDDAVRLVAALEEPENPVRRNFQAAFTAALQAGKDQATASEEALFRIFSDPPGAYGAGVNHLVDNKNWEKEADLATAYLVWGGYAYGRRVYAREAKAVFARRLATLDCTVKNEDSREVDIFDDDCFYAYHGGMVAAARAFGAAPLSFVGDSSDPRRVQVRTLAEEARRLFRARVLNPKYIAGMKRHGFKGAGDLSRMVDYIFGWDATARVIEDWMYAGLAARYLFDPEMRTWFAAVNPWALAHIAARLLEAIARGLWKADAATRQEIEAVYLEMEGYIEERLGGEFSGGGGGRAGAGSGSG